MINANRPKVQTVQSPPFRVPRRRRSLPVVAVVAALVGASSAAVLMGSSSRRFVLDGRFDEWEAMGVSAFRATRASGDPGVNLTSYAAHVEGTALLLWIEVEGAMLSDPVGYDTVHVFLDTDNDSATGYAEGGLGADYRLGVTGGKSEVAYADLFRFTSADAQDWRGWRPVAEASTGLSRRALEIELPISALPGFTRSFLASFVVEGNDGEGSSSAVAIGDGPAAISASLRRDAPVVFVGDTIGFLTLTLEGQGESRVEAVELEVHGRARVAVPGLPVLLSSASPHAELPLTLVAASANPGDSVRVGVARIVASAPVTLAGEEVAAYLFAPGTQKAVDGLFADWPDDQVRVEGASVRTPPTRDVDLLAYGVGYDSEHAYAYARMAGNALAGGRVPRYERPQPDREPDDSSGGETPRRRAVIPRQSAEDHLVVFFDADSESGTGEPRGGLGADWRIEVLGRRGKVTSSAVFRWSGEEWTTTSVEVRLSTWRGELEIGVRIPMASSPIASLEVTDWRGFGDATVFAAGGTRGRMVPTPPVVWPSIGWPPFWNPRASDPDDGLDPTLDILEVRAYNDWSSPYLYVRLVVEASPPGILNHTFWLYLDQGWPHDGNNDWLVEEKSRTATLCSYGWDAANGDWGVVGGGCDITDTMRDSDDGSAVRVVSNCIGARGCVDFALEKADYPGLSNRPGATAASDSVEDLDLLGSLPRNPVSAVGGCSVSEFDDCTVPFEVEISEFGDIFLATLIALTLGLCAVRRIRRPGQVLR